jgi:hypothetical protein
MWFWAVPVVVAGRFPHEGDKVTATLEVPQPARRRRGVTLIEAVLYIAVALALIVGGLVFYQQASVQSRTAAVVRLYSALMAEARIVAREGSISGPSAMNFEEFLYVRGSIPPENWDAAQPLGQRLRLPFPGMHALLQVNLAPTGVSTIALHQFNMPVSLCSRLFTATRTNTIYANGAFLAVFQDETFGPATSHSYFIFPTLTLTEAATYCRNADQNNNGRVQSLMYLRTAD